MQQPVPPPKPKKRHTVRWVVIGVVVLVVIIAIAASAGGDDDQQTADSTSSTGSPTTAAAEALVTTTSPPTTKAPATTTTIAGPTTTTTEVETTTTTMAPIQLTGRGDDIVEVPLGPALLHVTHSGSRNFAVKSFTAGGDPIDLLVNEIGVYEGTHIYDISDPKTAKLEITADGTWSVEVRDFRAMRELLCPGVISGKGPDVFFANGDPSQVTITHTGKSNFAIWYHPTSGRFPDLLVNEIGNYEGKKILPGAGIVVLQADGPWSFAAE